MLVDGVTAELLFVVVDAVEVGVADEQAASAVRQSDTSNTKTDFRFISSPVSNVACRVYG